MKLKIRVPKSESYGIFKLYVIGERGDIYNQNTEDIEVEFDPDSLVIPLNDRAVLERELNTITTRIFKFENLLGRAQNLYDSLLREEKIYNDSRFLEIPAPENPKEKQTVADKTAYLSAKSLNDPIVEKLWTYIGKSKVDVYDLTTCITALKGHLFKCKDFYNANFSYSRKPNDLPI